MNKKKHTIDIKNIPEDAVALFIDGNDSTIITNGFRRQLIKMDTKLRRPNNQLRSSNRKSALVIAFVFANGCKKVIEEKKLISFTTFLTSSQL